MKNTFLIIALMTAFSTVTISSYASMEASVELIANCDKCHKCDENCKKDKDGKCAEAEAHKAECKNKSAACCKKGQKSCKGKKAKSTDETKKEAAPKS